MIASSALPTKADTFLVSCIDPRLTDDTTHYFNALGRTDRYSEMRIAGAALAAIDTNRPAWNAAFWDNLAASRQMHGIRKVTFLNHRDCGAMTLWAGRSLAADPAEEFRQHTEVLNQAAEAVRARHPDLLVEIKLMDLDGSVRVLPCAACVPQGFRAEGFGPAAVSIAAASRGQGAEIAPVARDMAQADAAGFAELARVRAGAPLDPSAELALLSEGVTRYGLTAQAAREALEAAGARRGVAGGRAGARDVAAFLTSRKDRAGKIGSQDVTQAATLYRRLAGPDVTMAEARRRATAMAESESLAPRAEGFWPFRSTRWFRPSAQPGA
ncbi:hypothetical protein ACQW02_10500 [Humitalea sp. 24SJ18S-53]|uniref:hypothetical protein n=1 Tax=Humitalea sp. 24SJ18S-53 TaxID=3422307 RepID=UPI003D6701BC